MLVCTFIMIFIQGAPCGKIASPSVLLMMRAHSIVVANITDLPVVAHRDGSSGHRSPDRATRWPLRTVAVAVLSK